MGGDHKCPVCQATFTRPQHVARHMRSHTGDRPYKCNLCGDQFARSDLLSRHVNKCHAGEKNPGTAGTGKRKGTTRATTSKQACDQCVQSSLPCDGCNPCAKCVQRKCRCTYVKFHRQTAPIGPGHNPRPASISSSSSSSATHPSLLAGLPASTPSAYQHPLNQFSHLPGTSVYGTNDDFLLAPAPNSASSYTSNFTFPPVFDAAHSNPDSDFTSKYRAQAEIIRRGTSQHSQAWQPQSWSGSESDNEAMFGGYYGNYGSGRSGSEEGSSVPSSATSSSAHLPLDGPQQFILNGHGHARNNSSSSPPVNISQSQQHSHVPPLTHPDSRPGTSHSQFHYQLPPLPQSRPGTSSGSEYRPPASDGYRPGTSGEGGFSSAFGLMSLDDPNVLAGLASDGQPFFHDILDSLGVGTEREGDPNATPMPKLFDNPHGHANHHISATQSSVTHPHTSTRPSTASGTAYTIPISLSQVQTPGSREAETKELREFWKQYMRTPLSSGGGVLGASVNVNGDVSMLSPGPGSYRRQRVASLPTVKTPIDEGGPYVNNIHGWIGNGDAAKSSSSPNTGQNPPPAAAVGNADDLRSYEAAVLARKAPTNLSLVPRNRKKQTMPDPLAGAINGSGKVVAFTAGFHPESTSGSTSNGKRRPSFKRLASQTLEPDNAKRSRDDDGSSDDDDADDEDDESVVSSSVSPASMASASPPAGITDPLTAIGRKVAEQQQQQNQQQQMWGRGLGMNGVGIVEAAAGL